MNFFEDMGDWMFGGAQRNRKRVEERHTMDMKRMQSLLDSASGQQLLTKARAAALDRGEGYYGGRGEDPYVKGSEDLGKIRKAREEFVGDELTPETASYFEAAEQSVLDRMKSVPTPEVEQVAEKTKTKSQNTTEMDMKRMQSEEYFQYPDVGKAARAGFEMVAGQADMAKAGRAVSDYFQSSTDTVPEENIPKNYQQLGIESVDDMAIIDEMQKALPERDMKNEYESDPEYMQKLMMLWKKGKLNKSNLHKAFSALQQRARESLGVA